MPGYPLRFVRVRSNNREKPASEREEGEVADCALRGVTQNNSFNAEKSSICGLARDFETNSTLSAKMDSGRIVVNSEITPNVESCAVRR